MIKIEGMFGPMTNTEVYEMLKAYSESLMSEVLLCELHGDNDEYKERLIKTAVRLRTTATASLDYVANSHLVIATSNELDLLSKAKKFIKEGGEL